MSLVGHLQGAALAVGKGRVAVFGEIGMFNPEVTGPDQRNGTNTPDAKQNVAFLLNVMHWLTNKL